MNEYNFFSEKEIELIREKICNIFEIHSEIPSYTKCKYCPYNNKERCCINNILSLFSLNVDNICYYESILYLVQRFYPDFQNIIKESISKYLGRNCTDDIILHIKSELESNLFKYIDDMYYEGRFVNYEISLFIIFRFKDDIIFKIIDDVYDEVLSTFKKSDINE